MTSHIPNKDRTSSDKSPRNTGRNSQVEKAINLEQSFMKSFSADYIANPNKPHALLGGRAEDSTVGLLGGGGGDNKKTFNPSTRSRTGILHSLRGGQGVKIVCNSLATGHQVAKEIEALETASETASVTTSSHPAYVLDTSIANEDGNLNAFLENL